MEYFECLPALLNPWLSGPVSPRFYDAFADGTRTTIGGLPWGPMGVPTGTLVMEAIDFVADPCAAAPCDPHARCERAVGPPVELVAGVNGTVRALRGV